MVADRRIRAAMLSIVSTLVACGSSAAAPMATADASVDGDAKAGHAAKGKIIDLSGAPVVNVYVTVSTEFCIPDRTSTTGSFTVRNIVPSPAKRLIVYGPTANGAPHASLAFAFTGGHTGDFEFGKPIVVPRLVTPLTYDPSIVDPQRLATGDGFAITLRAGDLRIEGFDAPKLFAVQVPLEKAPPFGEPLSRLHALYVLEPLQSTVAKPAPVEFPNPRALAVGTKVDIVQLDYAKGVLTKAASGHVRDDGKVVSDDGAGITELTWIGFAPSGA